MNRLCFPINQKVVWHLLSVDLFLLPTVQCTVISHSILQTQLADYKPWTLLNLIQYSIKLSPIYRSKNAI